MCIIIINNVVQVRVNGVATCQHNYVSRGIALRVYLKACSIYNPSNAVIIN